MEAREVRRKGDGVRISVKPNALVTQNLKNTKIIFNIY